MFTSYVYVYIASIHIHDINDHMETNNRKDHLNDRDDPYDRDDNMELGQKDIKLYDCRIVFSTDS